jgi:hypothetical protein
MKKILLVSVFLLAFSLTASMASAQGVWFGLNLPLFSFGVGLGAPYYGGYGSGYNGGYYRPGYNGGYYRPSYNGGYYRSGYNRSRAPYYR